jgi:hypothetical protein
MGIHLIFQGAWWIVLIPACLCLSPLCIISSSLFDWTMSWIIDDQTITFITIMILMWVASLILIFQLIIDRSGKSIFFY